MSGWVEGGRGEGRGEKGRKGRGEGIGKVHISIQQSPLCSECTHAVDEDIVGGEHTIPIGEVVKGDAEIEDYFPAIECINRQ